jgi:8-oxo-dGTP pyrophosphatase MutT (NUDIX family)
MSREIHEPIGQEFFEKVLNGEKTFALQAGNFKYQIGDTLILNEMDGDQPTGRSIRKKIGSSANSLQLGNFMKRDIEKYGLEIISLLDENEVYHDSDQRELFQISAKAVLFNGTEDKIVLLQRADGFYSIPGGHLEKDETFENALRREIKEELSVDYSGALKLASVDKYYPVDGREGKIDLYFVGRLSENMPISIEHSGDELIGWEWAAVDEILDGGYTDWLVYLVKNILGRKDEK